eukprot:TRINITY_DN8877_c0_g1_i1.p2 TRINITY_DN8877_c0_g1~~TRINITY_DN8877_c0_g1_i1.p2  ORF type:complete len:208 (+),score=41.78 TRINITY_DN8877_c0_g1_i1:45-668(+)
MYRVIANCCARRTAAAMKRTAGFLGMRPFSSRPPTTDPYKVLGLPHGAKPEVVKERYLELCRKTHPDLVGGDAKRFKEISEAYRYIRENPTIFTEADAQPGPSPWREWGTQSKKQRPQNHHARGAQQQSRHAEPKQPLPAPLRFILALFVGSVLLKLVHISYKIVRTESDERQRQEFFRGRVGQYATDPELVGGQAPVLVAAAPPVV